MNYIIHFILKDQEQIIQINVFQLVINFFKYSITTATILIQSNAITFLY